MFSFQRLNKPSPPWERVTHVLCLAGLLATGAQARVVEYAFDIDAITVDFTGKPVRALAVDGRIPAPTIEATVGDVLRVTFHNRLDEESSVHWHGVLLPNDQDGVPWLTTQPIAAGASFTYEYEVTHAGTYWYHSHSGLQEQRGVYGALVFHPRHDHKSHHEPRVGSENLEAQRDYVVVLSDWTDEHPHAVLRHLKQDGDYYARKKNAVQSWDQVLAHGWDAVKNRVHGAWIRMGPMDVSDVGYDLFLANGKPEQTLAAAAGERVRLRLINAAASSYFYVEFAGGAMTIIAADGLAVEPRQVRRLRIAIAETYDVLVEIPERRAYALRATSEDGTGFSNTFVGAGERVHAPAVPAPNPYLMDHAHHGGGDAHDGGMSHARHEGGDAHDGDDAASRLEQRHDHDAKHRKHTAHGKHTGHAEHAGHTEHAAHAAHAGHDAHGGVIEHMTDYSALRARSPTTLGTDAPTREIRLALTGNMERYVWSFDGKTLSESDTIRIRKGENVRLVLENQTMMNHPLHLHGHFFRVLNGQGEHSPLKHTVNVARMDTTAIEFAANEDKDWFFHCHNLYHMHTGMARVISYADSSSAGGDVIEKIAHDDEWYLRSETALLHRMIVGDVVASNTRNEIELEYDYDYDRGYEAELFYKRYVGRFLNLQIGVNPEREDRHEAPETAAAVGIGYTLPLLIETSLRLDTDNDLSLRLHSELQLTERASLHWKYKFDDEDEYHVGLFWEINKTLSVGAMHHSDFHTGVGLQLTF